MIAVGPRPVRIAGTLLIVIEEDTGPITWHRLDASGPQDAVAGTARRLLEL